MRATPTTPTPEDLPRPVLAIARDYPARYHIARHKHRRAQLVYAEAGVMTVQTATGVWVIPPERAVWVPAGIEHAIDTGSELAMRSLYIEKDAAPWLPKACCVVRVSPLLRELIGRAVDLPALYDEDGPDGRLMRVILDQLETLPVAPLHLPMPRDARLKRITDALAQDPANAEPLRRWARRAGASTRTLARLFAKETRMSFGAWRQQLRLMKALEMLAARRPVTEVALDLGYASPSAFIAMFRRAFGVSPKRYFRDSAKALQEAGDAVPYELHAG
jgi:AraC-like DNA-binding protein